MLVKLFISPLDLLIRGFLNLLPLLQLPTERVAGLFNMIVTALNFIPSDVWLTAMSTITFWVSVHLITAIIHFIVGLIPVLNIRFGG